MSSLRHLSKRYGANIDRFPIGIQRMFEQMSIKSQLPALRPDAREVEKSKRYTKPQQWTVQVGDKVLITKGKYKGSITKVVALQDTTNRLFLEQSETRKIVVPKAFWQPKQDSHVIDYPVSVHPMDVKVVGTIVEDDGTERNIAADKLVFKGYYYDQDYKKMMPYRRIKYNENIILPWPRPEPIQDDEFSTSASISELRTHYTDSIVKLDVPSGFSIATLRDPTMKRAYKWDKKLLTKGDVNKLSGVKMPYSETKKKMFSERASIRESQIAEMPADVMQFIGDKVANHLNSVTDPNFKEYIDRNDSVTFESKKKLKEVSKKSLIDANKAAEFDNRIKRKLAKQNKGKLNKHRNGNKIW